MRCFRHAILIAAGMTLGLTLAGCDTFDPGAWFSSKKALPGERHLVFPEGVPGVTQGVPPDLVAGHQPADETTAAPADTAAASPPAGGATASRPLRTGPAVAVKREPEHRVAERPVHRRRVAAKPKPHAKPESKVATSGPTAKPKPKVAEKSTKKRERKTAEAPAKKREPAQAAAQPATQSQQDSVWGPPPGQSQTSGASAPWPAATRQVPDANAPWPAAPGSNTFSH